jgi:hypothetical protein
VTLKASAVSAAPYHHGNLRNALIAEGRRVLEEVGVRELSLRNLARAVGVSEAAPSRHFPGKEGLLQRSRSLLWKAGGPVNRSGWSRTPRGVSNTVSPR